MPTETVTTAVEVQKHLRLLLVERAVAGVEGLAANVASTADLHEKITATRNAYVGAAVTDIATLRSSASTRSSEGRAWNT